MLYPEGIVSWYYHPLMKRILIFSLNYFPFVGGAEVALKEVTDRIDPSDLSFDLIAYRFDSTLPKVEQIGNITVHRVGWGKPNLAVSESFGKLMYVAKIAYIPLAALAAVRLHHKRPYDGAWAMMTYMLFPIVLMRLLGVRLPYLLTLQEGDPFEHVFARLHIRLLLPLLQYGVRHAVRVQAISSFLLTWAGRLGFAGKGVVIPNGVDLAHFSRTIRPENVDDVRRALGKHAGEVYLVTTSRLVYKNAIDDVIRAVALLPVNVSFLVYGSGPEEASLQTLASELGLEERVRFMGHLGHETLPHALSACDIFIRPSRSEGMGNSFIEAMAAGIPVIATQEGGIADFLFDAKRNPDKKPTGWAVDPNSPEQIRAAVETILAKPERTAEVAARAKRLVSEKYDWKDIALRMRTLLGEVTGR